MTRCKSTIPGQLGGLFLLAALGVGGCQATIGKQMAAVGLGKLRSDAGLNEATPTPVEGHQVAVAEGGEGETVVLLHGFGVDKSSWFGFSGHLTKRFHVIAPDLPPFGDSKAVPGQSYTAEDQVRRLELLVEAKGLERFHLVGHSMGGHIAALYAHRHADKVITLGLFSAFGLATEQKSDVDKLIEQGENPFSVRTRADLEAVLDLGTFKRPDIPGPVLEYFAERAAAQADLMDELVPAYGAAHIPLAPVLPEIQTPTLVLFGANDRVVHPSAADGQHALLPKSKRVVFQECGHVPQMEYAGSAASEWMAFVDANRS